MTQSVLMGDPAYFQVRSGANPHTRDRWGRRKRVNSVLAVSQWRRLRATLLGLGVAVHTVKPSERDPGLVFPANAGFRHGGTVFLSNLHPGRAGEREHYRRALEALDLPVKDFPIPYRFEGEADFIPVADPSGPQRKKLFLFTHGRLERARWVPRLAPLPEGLRFPVG
jgi:N-dimethylarginine dimethylaminohydrolase